MAARKRTRPRRTTRRRAPKMGVVSGIWLALAALFTLLTFVFESITLCVLAVAAVCIAVIAIFCPDAAQIARVPAAPAGAKKQPVSGVKRVSRRPLSRRDTDAAKASKGVGCGAQCRRSTTSATLCNCACLGCNHGSENGRTFTGSRAEATSARARKTEREHVRKKEPWQRNRNGG